MERTKLPSGVPATARPWRGCCAKLKTCLELGVPSTYDAVGVHFARHDESARMSAIPHKATRREWRAIVLIILLNVAIIAAIGFVVAAWFLGDEWTYYTVGDYDLDQGRFIKIVGEKSSRSQAFNLRYEVIVNGKVTVSRDAEGAQFYSSTTSNRSSPREFSVVPANQGELVAITDRANHDDIVILHDFRTNQSWPASGKGGAAETVGREMLLRLQRVYPFFSCSTLTTYRPRWVWSPRLTHWLVTYPDLAAEAGADHSPRLTLRVFNTLQRTSSVIPTEYSSDEFGETAAVGWLGNDVVILSFDAKRTAAWKLAEGDALAFSPILIDDKINARAAELRASPGSSDQFVIPSPLLLLPEEQPAAATE